MTRMQDRRQHRRYAYPAVALEVDGQHYETVDWSLGGFRVNGYHQHLEVGDRITGTIGTVGSGSPGTFVAEVVRFMPNGDVGMRLLEITPSVFIAMAGLKVT